MHWCVDGTRAVTYCHCSARIFSYAGIICAIHIRRKRSVDRSVKRLEFMFAVWREDEDSHAILLHYSIVCTDKCKSCFFSNRNIGLSFESLACAMKCFTYLTKLSSVICLDGWTVS
jgi:hypothetical protein